MCWFCVLVIRGFHAELSLEALYCVLTMNRMIFAVSMMIRCCALTLCCCYALLLFGVAVLCYCVSMHCACAAMLDDGVGSWLL